jgi:uncharacterized protein
MSILTVGPGIVEPGIVEAGIVQARTEDSTRVGLDAGVDTAALDEGHPRRRALPVRILVLLVRAYQLSRTGRVSPCRFTPTCSAYAIEAVEHHGALRGTALTARRLGRCRPGGPSGYDPVPE